MLKAMKKIDPQKRDLVLRTVMELIKEIVISGVPSKKKKDSSDLRKLKNDNNGTVK